MRVKPKRKICFVVPQTYPFFYASVGAHFGGAERQAYFLGTALAERDEFEVHYCVADYGQGGREVRENCQLWPSFNFSENKLRSFFNICKSLQKINADVYIFRSANAVIWPLALYLKYLLKKKVVYMVAHLDEGSFARLVKISGWVAAVSMTLTYSLADVLCVQTKDQAQMFQGRNCRGANVVKNVFRYPVNVSRGKNVGDFTLWVGRCVDWKNPDIFLELVERHPEEQFVMVCPAGRDPKFFDELKKRAGLFPNLVFSGGETPDDLTNYYKRAKILAMTSNAEGFSNTMMESMAWTCPILSLGVDPDGIIGSQQLGVVAENKSTFFQAFQTLVNDPERCHQLGENGKKYLMENHTGSALLDRFAKLLI